MTGAAATSYVMDSWRTKQHVILPVRALLGQVRPPESVPHLLSPVLKVRCSLPCQSVHMSRATPCRVFFRECVCSAHACRIQGGVYLRVYPRVPVTLAGRVAPEEEQAFGAHLGVPLPVRVRRPVRPVHHGVRFVYLPLQRFPWLYVELRPSRSKEGESPL